MPVRMCKQRRQPRADTRYSRGETAVSTKKLIAWAFIGVMLASVGPAFAPGVRRPPVRGYAASLSSITRNLPTARSAFSTWLMWERWFGSTILRTALS